MWQAIVDIIYRADDGESHYSTMGLQRFKYNPSRERTVETKCGIEAVARDAPDPSQLDREVEQYARLSDLSEEGVSRYVLLNTTARSVTMIRIPE